MQFGRIHYEGLWCWLRPDRLALDGLAVLLAAALLCAPSAAAQSTTITGLAISSGGTLVNTAMEGSVVTLTATVTLATGGAAAPPGQVNFCEVKPAPSRCTDIRLLGTVQLNSAGKAVLNLEPSPGTHNYQAVFLGTHSEAASSSNQVNLVVSTFYPSTTAITNVSFLSAGTYTVTTTVTGDGGIVSPTGTVSLVDTSNANYVLGTAPLVPGAVSPGSGFSDAVTPSTTSGWSNSIAAGDFNGDGKLDVIVGWDVTPLPNPYMASVNLGKGDGTFGQGLPLSVAAVGAVADFNGDGNLDLVVPSGGVGGTSSNNLQVMMGNGNGTFTPGPTASTAFGNSVAVGDFNGDGIEDLAVANTAAGSVTILLGNGDGSFSDGSAPQAGVNPMAIAVGDFNNDGNLDLAVVNGATNGSVPGSVTILQGHGDGTFTQVGPAIPTWQVPTGIVTADFSGDGILDLAVANEHGTNANQSGAISILLGNGNGTFTPTGIIQPPNRWSGFDSVAVGDFNGDGKADLVGETEVLTVFPGLPPSYESAGIVSVISGNGDGTFAPIVNPSTNGPSYKIAPGNFNGLEGIAVAIWDPNSQQASEMVDVLSPAVSTATATATVSDFFLVGPGLHEVIASYPGNNTYQSSTSLAEGLTGEPEPTTLTLTANPAATLYGQQVLLTATLSPDPVENYSATGSITFMNGNAVIGVAPVSNGIATLNTTSLPLGANSLTASYPGDTNFLASNASALETVSGYSTTTTLAASPNPANPYQLITLTATVIPSASAMSAPTGLVTFYDGSTVIGQMAVDGNGHAIYTTSTLAIGTHTLTASYSGAVVFYGSKSAADAVTINSFGSATVLSAAPNPAGTGQTVTLTATVTGINSGIVPIGTVMFYNGGTLLGQGTINAAGTASLGVSSLPVGTYSLTAVYAGGGVYTGSSSAAVIEQIVPMDFSIALSNPSVTLETYHHTTTSVTLTSISGFADSMGVSCVNPPQYVTCIFTPNPAALASGGTATVSLYIDTSSVLGVEASAGPIGARRGLPPGLALLCLPLGLFVGMTARRRRLRVAALVAAILPIAMVLGGCGANIIIPLPGASPGTYSIPVTATAAAKGMTHTAMLTLNVTP